MDRVEYQGDVKSVKINVSLFRRYRAFGLPEIRDSPRAADRERAHQRIHFERERPFHVSLRPLALIC